MTPSTVACAVAISFAISTSFRLREFPPSSHLPHETNGKARSWPIKAAGGDTQVTRDNDDGESDDNHEEEEWLDGGKRRGLSLSADRRENQGTGRLAGR